MGFLGKSEWRNQNAEWMTKARMTNWHWSLGVDSDSGFVVRDYSFSLSLIFSWARFFAAISPPIVLGASPCWPLGWIFFGGGGTGLSVAPPTTEVMSPV